MYRIINDREFNNDREEGKSVNMYDMSDKDFEKEYGLTEGRRVVGGTAILSLFIYIGIVYPLLKRNVKGE